MMNISKKMYRIVQSSIMIYLLLGSSIANAHVQWFVAPEEMIDIYFGFDITYVFITLMVSSLVFGSLFFTHFPHKLSFIKVIISTKISIDRKLYVAYFTVLNVIFFMLLVLQGGFVAPNLNLPSELIGTGLMLQAVIVITAAFSVSLSGIMIIFSTVFMIGVFPLSLSINYLFEFFAVGIFMLLAGPYVSRIDKSIFKRFNIEFENVWSIGMSTLRVGIGLQLVVLAFTEKLINPGLSLVFIEMYPFYNFFPTLGFEMVSDLHFVYFVGLSELVLGALLISGKANRVVMLMLTFAFVTTALIHGAHEVEGHLPIFAAALLLLLDYRNKVPVHKYSFDYKEVVA